MNRDSTKSRHPVALIGAGGKLGTLLAPEIEQSTEFFLAHRITRADTPETIAPFPRGVLAIDASAPIASPQYLAALKHAQGRLMVLSSGFGAVERAALEQAAAHIPILFAPNTSRALWVFRALVAQAAQQLGPEFEAAIFETHHSAKRDAPSATALVLRDSLAKLGRETVGVASARYGDVPGEHSVFFGGAFERIELIHRVRDRRLFARGAVQLAPMFMTKPPGYYTPPDLWADG